MLVCVHLGDVCVVIGLSLMFLVFFIYVLIRKVGHICFITTDTMSTIQTQVLGQTTTMVSLDTDASITARQGAAWKISGWPENIAIHHAKGCTCCHEYINHLLRAQSLGQINLQHIDIENAVQSAWPMFINSIKIDADQRIQGQLSHLHVQINELKDFLATRRSHTIMRRLRSQTSTVG